MRLIISEKSKSYKIKKKKKKLSNLLSKDQFDNLEKFIYEYQNSIKQNPNVFQEYLKTIKNERVEIRIIIKNSSTMNILERFFCI